ncbi:MAG TPA: SDR family oxidoreductase [Methanomicrobiales archaeon]|nr:SDR family oxidoreductase [Methanomicrobiales archaeon]
MKYLITGGAGFIGSHLADALAGTHELVVLDNLATGKAGNIQHLIEARRVSLVRGSVTDPALLKTCMEGVDGVFHEAALVSVLRSVKDPDATNEANVAGTLRVLVAARDAGVKAVVFASSSSVYGESPVLPKREDMPPVPKSPYAVSKLAGEHYLRVFSELYGLRTVSLRYFNVFGPRQDPESPYAAVIPLFITRVLRGEPIVIHGDGGQTRDFTYVKDVVQGNLKAMASGARGTFNLACGERNSVLALARAVMEIAGKEVPIRHEPPRPGDIRDSLADISAARERLKYAPGYTLRTGLEETVPWYMKK